MGKRYPLVLAMLLYVQLGAATAPGLVQLFKGPHKVPAGESLVLGFMFDVRRGETLCVSGWFSASGGDDGALCSLYDEPNYELAKCGESAGAIYTSGRP